MYECILLLTGDFFQLPPVGLGKSILTSLFFCVLHLKTMIIPSYYLLSLPSCDDDDLSMSSLTMVGKNSVKFCFESEAWHEIFSGRDDGDDDDDDDDLFPISSLR